MINITRLSLTLGLCLAGFACSDHSSNQAPKITYVDAMEPPLPIAEPIAEPVYGNGFEKADVGIDFIIGYLNPEDTPPPDEFTQHPEAFAGGIAAEDIDADGDIDILITRGDIGPNLLYINDGTGHFSEEAELAGIANTKSNTENYRHSGPAIVDIDGDGYRDIFLGGLNGDPSLLFLNKQDGTFTNVTANSGLDMMQSEFTISSAFADYDLDGDIDLFLTHWGSAIDIENPPSSEHLWRNDSVDGQIQFTDVSIPSQVTLYALSQPAANSVLGDDYDATFTPNFADINNDRYPDILLASDFRTSRILLNNKDGTFSNITDPNVIRDDSGMGGVVADFDNDLDLDWFVSAIHGEIWRFGNRYYQNNSGTFSDFSVLAGINSKIGTAQEKSSWGWGSCGADFDLNGYLDIYLTNGFPFSNSSSNLSFDFDRDITRVFMGIGGGIFSESAKSLNLNDTSSSRTAVCADFDNDGDIDILQLNRNAISSAQYYRNYIPKKHFLKVSLHDPNSKNSEALGARIYVATDTSLQMREVKKGSSFTAHDPTLQVFGLDINTNVNTLRVVWPDGSEQQLFNIAADQLIEIRKKP